jgi:hypothetical protein
MRHAEWAVLALAVLVPLVIVFMGWPMLASWVAGPSRSPTPETAGAAATSVATARGIPPTPRPTIGMPPTLEATQRPIVAAPTSETAQSASGQATTAPRPAEVGPTATPAPAATPAARAAPAQPTPALGNTAMQDPRQTVASFYALVAQHQFDSAVQLWSPHMRSAFPPRQNIDERFSQTRRVVLRQADVVAVDPSAGQATVAVDLVEDTPAGSRHYVGNWSLVRGPNGWLLDQPDLKLTP